MGCGDLETTPPRVGNTVEVELVGVITPSDPTCDTACDDGDNGYQYPPETQEDGCENEYCTNSEKYHSCITVYL